MHAPADYRQHLAAVLSRRALEKAHARCQAREEQSMMTSEKRKIALTVNGKRYEEEVEVRVTLADFMRHQLGLTGTHLGCEHGVCGACTILFDGRSARSCLMLAVQADGHEILTVEGIAPSADRAAPAAGGVPRQSRAAMRLLHAGDADHADRIPARQSRSDRAGGADRDLRQSLPLHRLSGHRHRDACSRKEAAGGRGTKLVTSKAAMTAAFSDKKVIAELTAKMLLEVEAVRFMADKPFIFTSGWASPVYTDCRRLISFPRVRRTLIDFAVATIAREAGFEQFDAVAGGETAGHPVAAWMADRLELADALCAQEAQGLRPQRADRRQDQ